MAKNYDTRTGVPVIKESGQAPEMSLSEVLKQYETSNQPLELGFVAHLKRFLGATAAKYLQQLPNSGIPKDAYIIAVSVYRNGSKDGSLICALNLIGLYIQEQALLQAEAQIVESLQTALAFYEKVVQSIENRGNAQYLTHPEVEYIIKQQEAGKSIQTIEAESQAKIDATKALIQETSAGKSAQKILERQQLVNARIQRLKTLAQQKVKSLG